MRCAHARREQQTPLHMSQPLACLTPSKSTWTTAWRAAWRSTGAALSLQVRCRAPSAARHAPGLTLCTAGCHSGDVVLWDFETRGVARVLSGGHSADVLSLSWSHDGRRVASACADSQLRVWDVLSAKPVHAVKLAGKPVRVELLFVVLQLMPSPPPR